MGKVGPQRPDRNQEIGSPQKLLVVILWQNLTSLQNRLEGDDGGSLLDNFCPELLSEFVSVPPVTIPAGKVVVPHQQGHGQSRKGGSHHSQMGGAPHPLANKLRMPGDSDDPCLPQMQLGFFDGGNLLEIKDAGIQKEKAQKVDCPGNRMGDFVLLQVVKLNAVVGVGNKIGNPRVGQTQAGKGKDDPPGSSSHNFFSVRPCRSQTAVDNRKEDSKKQSHPVGVSAHQILDPVQKVVRISGVRVDPENGNRREDGGDGSAKGEPSPFAEFSPFLVLNVELAGVLSDNLGISTDGG
mmetsp:Transcript_20687/g.42571  ORF Transcript_20687/g.42571 Transcript_20687/m.42571 type:complete len:295 (+) Transcript_20687:183-1067(+)